MLPGNWDLFYRWNICNTLSTGIKPLRDYHDRFHPSITDPPKGEDSTDNKNCFCYLKSKESDEQTCPFLSLFKGLDVFRSKGAHCVRPCTTITCARYADHGKKWELLMLIQPFHFLK